MNLLQALQTVIALSIANAFICYTIAESLFFHPFRTFLHARSFKYPLVNFLYNLFSCPYCLSHWGAIIAVLVWDVKITHCGFSILDGIVSMFMIVGLSSLAWGTFAKLVRE